MAVNRPSSAEILEIEGKDRELAALCECHDRGIYETEIEVGVLGVDLGCAAEQPRGHLCDAMLPAGKSRQERARGIRANPRTDQVVDLGDHRDRDDQISSEAGDQRCREIVRPVPSIHRRDQGPGVGDRPQCSKSSWAKISRR